MMNLYGNNGRARGFTGVDRFPYRRRGPRNPFDGRGYNPYNAPGKPVGQYPAEQSGVRSAVEGRNQPRQATPCGVDTALPRPADAGTLLRQIRAVDFALYETVLYLDVYPKSTAAMETYQRLKTQREELHAAYEAAYGPLTPFGNESETSWDWVKGPFPWEYDAN